ncbi:uncharacterized protein IUM83_14084 [Phytophthora cinnamomi]|uniref:uncharacterized protein n=1 Tax=Phytophthora cinnamomi TaxID=4785 RepID=UPI0035598B5A|nr:hypothetical protein IUM83_14084 [Phytophthora cinnamomi]
MLSLRQVFRQKDGGVLLGFSSDVYCISLDSHYEVQWRRVDFEDFHHWRGHGQAPETVFKLRVGGGSSAYGARTPLEVWQSADEALALAATFESFSEERERSRLCRVAMAPSPMFDDGGLAAKVTSLTFELSQHGRSQKMEEWQLMKLERERRNVHHLIVSSGATVHVLVLRVWESWQTESAALAAAATPRGLGISHFPENAWYYPPVFPIKFLKVTEHRHQDTGSDTSFTVGVECTTSIFSTWSGFWASSWRHSSHFDTATSSIMTCGSFGPTQWRNRYLWYM